NYRSKSVRRARFKKKPSSVELGLLRQAERPQLEVPAMVLLTLEKVLLALLPRAVMATMHTTMMRANMTAYSTAVGPSSRFRKFTTLCASFFITHDHFWNE